MIAVRNRLLLAFTIALAACAPPAAELPQPVSIDALVPAAWAHPIDVQPAVASTSMVSTDAALATDVGTAILRDGGNAIDAAVATAFALAVVYPEAGNLGGGGFIVARMADGTTASLDFREKAPLAATRTMYVDAQGNVTDQSLVGHLASGVPGAVAGLYEAHRRFGSKPWAELVAPAIRLARDGFVVNEALAKSLVGSSSELQRFASSRELYMRNGAWLTAGTHWRNPELAAVLERIAERGADGFYRGETADLIVAEMRRGNGLITHDDLARYRATWRDPVVTDYRGYTLVSMPPASSGGLTLALIANILEGYDLRSLGWHSPAHLHVTAEAMRRAFADRNHYLGDPDFVDIPRAQFLSDEYASQRRASIQLGRATPSTTLTHGTSGAMPEPEHTTHFSVIDAQGNAVALTTTVNDLYGSGVVVAGAGFVLNDEMDDFTSKPGVPNAYGLVQGEANAIAPEKRMLSAMTPTIVVDRAGQPVLVTGARGGPRIITGTWQVISNVIDFGMDVQTATNAPRIHHQHLPDILYAETNGLTAEMIAALRSFGHTVEDRAGVGSTNSILRRGGALRGAPDPRSTGGKASGN